MEATDNPSLVRRSIAYLKRIESKNGAQSLAGSFLSLEAGESDTLPVKMFSHELAVFYVYDDGTTFTYVSDAMREEAGLSYDELHEVALANLARRFRDMEMHQANGMFVLAGLGKFEASMVLLGTLWDQLSNRYFPNGVIAALPARDVLGVCDAKEEAAIAHLQATTQKLWDDDVDYLLARQLYARSAQGVWTPLP